VLRVWGKMGDRSEETSAADSPATAKGDKLEAGGGEVELLCVSRKGEGKRLAGVASAAAVA